MSFLSWLEQELENIREDLKHIRPLRMTEEEQEAHNNTGKCWICDGPFKPYKDGDCHGLWKVKDHCHITGEYRGAAHSKCNQQLRIDPFRTPIPVFFHNLKNYDSHHLISAIGRTRQTEKTETICTPVTDGKRKISFSWGQFRFVDSFAFLNSSHRTRQRGHRQTVTVSGVIEKTDGREDLCSLCRTWRNSSPSAWGQFAFLQIFPTVSLCG